MLKTFCIFAIVFVLSVVVAEEKTWALNPTKVLMTVATTPDSGFFVVDLTPMIFKIPYKHINKSNSLGKLKELAVFYHLKKLYSNSCIFSYNPNSLSKKSGMSITAIRRYIGIFRSNGWIIERDNNIIFNKLLGKQLYTFNTKTNNIDEINTYLKLSPLKTKLNQCQYLITKRTDLQYPKTLQDYKSARKFSKKYDLRVQGEMSDKIRLSIFTLSQIWNCSKTEASRLLNKLKEHGLVLVEKNRSILFSGVSAKFFKSIRDTLSGYCYFHKGRIVQLSCNTISLAVDRNNIIPKKYNSL